MPDKSHYFSHEWKECLLSDWSMDSGIYEYLMDRDLVQDRKRRQELYLIWEERLRKRGLKPVFHNMPDGAMPMVCPMYTSGLDETKYWVGWGLQNQVDVYTYPTLPYDLVESEAQSYQRWQRLVCFPIHADMNPEQIISLLE